MMFLINIDCLGAYVVLFINEKNLKFKCLQPGGGGGGVRIFEHIKSDLRTKLEDLQVILSR